MGSGTTFELYQLQPEGEMWLWTFVSGRCIGLDPRDDQDKTKGGEDGRREMRREGRWEMDQLLFLYWNI